VGEYVANAVCLLCHGTPAPLLDVNMARVLERAFGARETSDIRYDPWLQALSRRVVQHAKARDLNWAILDLAATVCAARLPRCAECPVHKFCIHGSRVATRHVTPLAF
jgi:A/G-specific adenine glycosylase